MIISSSQAPSLPTGTMLQPLRCAGYNHARENVPAFSASQMNPATSANPSSSGMRR